MDFDFSKIKAKKKEPSPIDPIELFQKLKVSDSSINDLWLAQGDALREWHKNREKRDVGVVLNTGAGKTLVGLLIAQSLVNETRGKVLYACSSIQLVEQTAEKAKGYGIDVTTYHHREYSNDLFIRGEAPCITTYQALFNGKSVFFREDISALVFDDAHAAEHLLRDHFSVRIKRDTFPGLYSSLHALFKSYHQEIGKRASYDELEDPASGRMFFIPPFEIQNQLGELLRLLQEAKLASITETTFAWEYLHDRVDLCCLLMTGSEITITPPFVPVLTLPYFREDLKRVYLSATLSAPDAFARTFGRVPDLVVAPATTAGECERLILVPSRLQTSMPDTEVAKKMVAERKALILVPTYGRAEMWSGIAVPPPKDEVTEVVRKFKADTSTPKLLLAARYDGVDLPGDTCRVMVVDDLPMGVGPLERFLWEYLSLSNTLRSAIASRIVQSFGRISRGMSDHGVVILTGERLVNWLLVPKNRAILPEFLQKQISLGVEVSETMSSIDELNAAANQCLNRDAGWTDAYAGFMADAEPEKIEQDTEILTALAKAEASFAEKLWRREYDAAAQALAASLEKAFLLSTNTGAWHSLWLGRALELSGDRESALELYVKAHSNQFHIPQVPKGAAVAETVVVPEQIMEVEQQIKIAADGTIALPKSLHKDLVFLDGTGTTSQTEEALRALGQYLGLQSTRPDKEFGTGPDVLWIGPGLPALCIEVKSDKDPSVKYKKEYVGQLSDHVQWVKNNTEAGTVIPMFIGPVIGATTNSNPPDEFLVASVGEFQSLAQRLISALQDGTNSALPLTLRSSLIDVFQERQLLWPTLLQTITSHKLRDL